VNVSDFSMGYIAGAVVTGSLMLFMHWRSDRPRLRELRRASAEAEQRLREVAENEIDRWRSGVPIDWEDICGCGHNRRLHRTSLGDPGTRCCATVGWDEGGFVPKTCRCPGFAKPAPKTDA